MGRCETCGNEYERSFEIYMGNERYTFDSFECAIQALAPICGHCGCRVIGHGVESDNSIFCCAHCAHASGVTDVSDHSAASTERSTTL